MLESGCFWYLWVEADLVGPLGGLLDNGKRALIVEYRGERDKEGTRISLDEICCDFYSICSFSEWSQVEARIK